MGVLDQQEIPALHLHHVSPGNVVCFTSTGTQASINVTPDFLQQAGYAAEAAEVCQVSESHQTLLEEGAEGGVHGADRSTDEIHPDETAIEPNLTRGNKFQHLRELGNEADAARLAGSEPWHKTAQIDSCSNAERRSHVLAELFWAENPIGVEGDFWSRIANFGQADLIAERVDVCAQLNVVHAIFLQSFQTRNFGNQVHDAIFTAHQLAKSER